MLRLKPLLIVALSAISSFVFLVTSIFLVERYVYHGNPYYSTIFRTAATTTATKNNNSVRHKDGESPEFILHIGPPKTATTTLQCELMQNHKLLDESSPYRYMGKFHTGECHLSLAQISYRSSLLQGRNLGERILYNLRYERKSVILSDESYNGQLMVALHEKQHQLKKQQQHSQQQMEERNPPQKQPKQPDFLQLIQSLQNKNTIQPTHSILNIRTRIILTYRRYYEWVPSYYRMFLINSSEKSNPKKYKCLISLESYLENWKYCHELGLFISHFMGDAGHPVMVSKMALEDFLDQSDIDIDGGGSGSGSGGGGGVEIQIFNPLLGEDFVGLTPMTNETSRKNNADNMNNTARNDLRSNVQDKHNAHNAQNAQNHILFKFSSQILNRHNESQSFLSNLISGKGDLSLPPLHTTTSLKLHIECIHLMVAAFGAGLIDDSKLSLLSNADGDMTTGFTTDSTIDLKYVLQWLRHSYDEILHLFFNYTTDASNTTDIRNGIAPPFEFPTTCLSSKWQTHLLEQSLKFEKELFPDLFPQWAGLEEVHVMDAMDLIEQHHRDQFQKYSDRGNFCQWDTHAIVSHEGVREFIRGGVVEGAREMMLRDGNK